MAVISVTINNYRNEIIMTQRTHIGSFIVETEAGLLDDVIVSQEVVNLYEKNRTYNGKYLTLSTIDGPRVISTDRDNIFKLEDGTELRKRFTKVHNRN
jgi:hypothetical protein